MKTLVQSKEGFYLDSFFLPEPGDSAGIETGGDLLAEIVDTDDVACMDAASFRTEKETALAVGPVFRELCAENQIDQEEISAVIVLQPQTAARTAS